MCANSDIVRHSAGDYLLECGRQTPELGADTVAGIYATSFQLVAGLPPPATEPPPIAKEPPNAPPPTKIHHAAACQKKAAAAADVRRRRLC
jgi:hypothetical protein